MWVVYNPSKCRGGFVDKSRDWHQVKPGGRVVVDEKPVDWTVNVRVVEGGHGAGGKVGGKPKPRPESKRGVETPETGVVTEGMANG